MATNAQPIAVIARLLDLSERRVQQLSREGVIPKGLPYLTGLANHFAIMAELPY